MAIKRISDQKAAFLSFELTTKNARRQKVALQEISRLYRTGNAFAPETRLRIEQQIVGLSSMTDDRKVIRWCMNSLARLGTKESIASVEHTLKKFDGDPEIIAASVSALSHLRLGEIGSSAALSHISPEVKTLAAMQTVPPERLKATGLQLNLSNADPEILKLALIVVGLDRDIQHLLHPKHENGEIVRELGQHDNQIVRQYSIWAVLENSRLTIDHLGVPFDRLELEPPNVQSKLLQLGASQLADLNERQDLILKGCDLPSVDAREGLAKGLASHYYDGLEGVTLDWYETDGSTRIQLILAEHFGRFSNAVPSYHEKALEAAERGGEFRERVLLGAEGRPLYSEIKRSEAKQSPDLFGVDADVQMESLAKRLQRQSPDTVLLLNATPEDQGWIRADKEGALLERHLAGVTQEERKLEFVHRHAVRTSDIQKELLNHRPSILHFSGHGDPGVLLFERADGSTDILSGEHLAEILRLYGNLECVLLHACFTEAVARECAKQVEFVIGSTAEIDDNTAPKFSYAFYQALVNGRDYLNAFEMGKAEVALVSTEQADLYRLFSRRA